MTTNTNAASADLHRLVAKAFSEYLDDCYKHAIKRDIVSAFTYAFEAGAALSTAAQPPADGALNTIAAMFHSAEEIEGPDGLAMMVDMSVWNDALDAFDEIIGDEMEPTKEQT